MSVEWIDYKDKKILLVRYTGLKQPEQLDQIMKATQTILDSGSKKVLSLSDMTDVFVNNEFMDLSKKQGLISLPLTKKAAVVGITGLKTSF